MATTTYTEGIGRRKTAQARVRITPAKEVALTVNDMTGEEYFATPEYVTIALEPFTKDDTIETFAVSAKVQGGGKRAQAEAVRHGISRALIIRDEKLRPALKSAGFLTRDSRVKERKKPGLKKARKSAQWSKR